MSRILSFPAEVQVLEMQTGKEVKVWCRGQLMWTRCRDEHVCVTVIPQDHAFKSTSAQLEIED